MCEHAAIAGQIHSGIGPLNSSKTVQELQVFLPSRKQHWSHPQPAGLAHVSLQSAMGTGLYLAADKVCDTHGDYVPDSQPVVE